MPSADPLRTRRRPNAARFLWLALILAVLSASPAATAIRARATVGEVTWVDRTGVLLGKKTKIGGSGPLGVHSTWKFQVQTLYAGDLLTATKYGSVQFVLKAATKIVAFC